MEASPFLVAGESALSETGELDGTPDSSLNLVYFITTVVAMPDVRVDRGFALGVNLCFQIPSQIFT
jgi:hypothetical protein